ncbi:MAG TPA: hypothetical protein VF691_21870 [Cytophagaceae bacterium]|jgi:hypothetical protein
MRLSKLLLLLTFGFFSCDNDKLKINIQTNGRLVLVDSSAQTENLEEYDPDYRSGVFPIYYMGILNDTIRLGQKQISASSHGQKNYDGLRNFTYQYSANLKITVDTGFSVVHTYYYSHFDLNDDKKVIDSTKSIKAFPVFVYNVSDSLMLVGSHSE